MSIISIITVCLNSEDEIKNTILSVLEQDCDNFEYIIQDGESKDQTVNIAESFAVAFSDRGIPFRINSQRDKGIYDAMNTATQNAQGEWVIFMNAGDCFADKTVLSQIIRNEKLKTADIVYGDVIMRKNNQYLYQKARALEKIRFGMPFCHQSVVTKKELLEAVPFSLQYRICSDYLFFLQMYLEGKEFEYLPMAFTIYDGNGISSDYNACLKEMLKIYEKMPVRDEEAILMVDKCFRKKAKYDFMREHLWNHIPSKLRQIGQDYLRKKAGWKTEEEIFLNNK